MKVLPFTIPVPHDHTIIVQKDILPYFYPHLHRHEEIQMTWIRQGEGTLIADNNMHAFKANDIFWLGANQPHLFKSDPIYFLPKSDKNIEAIVLFFNPNGALEALFNLPEMSNVKRFLQQNPNGFKVPLDMTDAIAEKLSQIYEQTGVEQLIHFMDLLRLLSSKETLEALSEGARPKLYSDNEGLRMSNIYNFIIQEYENPITLEDAASKAYMTPHAFCRYFKKHTGHTFLSFLNEVRINEACKKLTNDSPIGIAQVAYSCGFNSITNFNRIFKRIKGQSPSEYLEEFFK